MPVTLDNLQPELSIFRGGLIIEKETMEPKPTYDELQKRVLELEIEAANCKFAEESLKKSNETVNSILSACPIGIGLVENRIIKRVNEAMKKMFHFETEADYLGKSARIVYASDEDFQKTGDFILNQFKIGKEAVLDTTFRRKDGSTFAGHLMVNTLYPPRPHAESHLYHFGHFMAQAGRDGTAAKRKIAGRG